MSLLFLGQFSPCQGTLNPATSRGTQFACLYSSLALACVMVALSKMLIPWRGRLFKWKRTCFLVVLHLFLKQSGFIRRGLMLYFSYNSGCYCFDPNSLLCKRVAFRPQDPHEGPLAHTKPLVLRSKAFICWV